MKRFVMIVAAALALAPLGAAAAQDPQTPTKMPTTKSDAKAEQKADKKDDKSDAKKDAKTVDPADMVGKWDMTIETPQGTLPGTLDLKLTGKKLTGTISSQMMGEQAIDGSFTGGKIKFSIMMGGGQFSVDFDGKVKEDGTIQGTIALGPMGEMKWTAEHVKK